MPIPFTTRVSVAPDALVQDLGDESVILNLKTESYLGLDDVGTGMWKALTTSASIEVAYRVLLAEYDVDPDVLRHDLGELVEQLVEHGLVDVEAG